MESILKINRCIGYTKNNKKCRAKILNSDSFFCCTDHEPKNKEILTSSCFMCSENIEKSSDLVFFKCKHAFHKQCYEEWILFSTYEDLICIICRTPVNFGKNKEKRVLIKYNNKTYTDVNKINKVLFKKPEILEINIYNYNNENLKISY